MMEILIVVPRLVHLQGAYYHFPIGLVYVASALRAAGYGVHVINQNAPGVSLRTEMRRILQRKQVRVVCSGGLTPDYGSVREIFAIAREIRPDIITICGGGLITSEPLVVSSGLGVDVGVCAEGEETLVNVVAGLSAGEALSTVPGIVFRDGKGRYHQTKRAAAIEDIDKIPFPDYEGFGIEGYLERQAPNDNYATAPMDDPRMMQIVGSRSCPFNCSFCFHPLGKKYRQRSLENIFLEIDSLIERYHANIFMFYDELFANTQHMERVAVFCRKIKRRGVFWRVSLRVDAVHSDLLHMMRDAGCHYISYGIENVSSNVLGSMGKQVTRAQIENALRLTQEAGIGIQGNLLFGDPAETPETIKENLNWWAKNQQYQLHLVPIATFPGSRLYRNALENGKIKDPLSYIENGDFYVNHTALSDTEYRRMIDELRELQKTRLVIEAQCIDYKNKGNDKFGRSVSAYTVICPHCRQTVPYSHIVNQAYTTYNIRPDLHKLSCRCCHQRFDVPAAPSLPDKRTDRYPIIRSRRVTADEVAACKALAEKIGSAAIRFGAYDAEDHWTAPDGSKVYGAVSNTLRGKIQESFLNRLRNESFMFTGWRLDNLEAADPIPSVWDELNTAFQKSPDDPDWSIAAFRHMTAGLPRSRIYRPPLVCGEAGYDVDGYCVNRDVVFYQERINILHEHGIIDRLKRRELREQPTILEIGGGYGAMAYIMKKLLPACTYINIDLPRSLIFSGCYLTVAQPQVPVHLYLPGEAIKPSAVNLVFSTLYNALPDTIRFDLAINTLSFAEMPAETVRRYGDFIRTRLSDHGVLMEQNFDNAGYKRANFCNPKQVLDTIFNKRVDLEGDYLLGKPTLWSNQRTTTHIRKPEQG